jgi:MinD superfamily P-loop ATPase
MRVAIASGKGGTGKTLIATNLAWTLARRGAEVAYLDADVEGPNGHLFLRPVFSSVVRHAVHVPEIAGEGCSACGLCEQACVFSAIVAIDGGVRVFPELCHSCGVCVRGCPEQALVEVPHESGSLRQGHAGDARFVDGLLDVGEPRAAPLVQAVCGQWTGVSYSIVDAPPGTSCAAVAAVDGADLVLLVCEPTPFGLHDLELSVEMCRSLGIEIMALINRADLGDDSVRAFLEAEGVPLLAEVPFDREIAQACARGVLASTSVPSFASVIDAVAGMLTKRNGSSGS